MVNGTLQPNSNPAASLSNVNTQLKAIIQQLSALLTAINTVFPHV
jgi:hypothetical protein